MTKQKTNKNKNIATEQINTNTAIASVIAPTSNIQAVARVAFNNQAVPITEANILSSSSKLPTSGSVSRAASQSCVQVRAPKVNGPHETQLNAKAVRGKATGTTTATVAESTSAGITSVAGRPLQLSIEGEAMTPPGSGANKSYTSMLNEDHRSPAAIRSQSFQTPSPHSRTSSRIISSDSSNSSPSLDSTSTSTSSHSGSESSSPSNSLKMSGKHVLKTHAFNWRTSRSNSRVSLKQSREKREEQAQMIITSMLPYLISTVPQAIQLGATAFLAGAPSKANPLGDVNAERSAHEHQQYLIAHQFSQTEILQLLLKGQSKDRSLALLVKHFERNHREIVGTKVFRKSLSTYQKWLRAGRFKCRSKVCQLAKIIFEHYCAVHQSSTEAMKCDSTLQVDTSRNGVLSSPSCEPSGADNVSDTLNNPPPQGEPFELPSLVSFTKIITNYKIIPAYRLMEVFEHLLTSSSDNYISDRSKHLLKEWVIQASYILFVQQYKEKFGTGDADKKIWEKIYDLDSLLKYVHVSFWDGRESESQKLLGGLQLQKTNQAHYYDSPVDTDGESSTDQEGHQLRHGKRPRQELQQHFQYLE